jgi:hypothetical protein
LALHRKHKSYPGEHKCAIRRLGGNNLLRAPRKRGSVAGRSGAPLPRDRIPPPIVTDRLHVLARASADRMLDLIKHLIADAHIGVGVFAIRSSD